MKDLLKQIIDEHQLDMDQYLDEEGLLLYEDQKTEEIKLTKPSDLSYVEWLANDYNAKGEDDE